MGQWGGRADGFRAGTSSVAFLFQIVPSARNPSVHLAKPLAGSRKLMAPKNPNKTLPTPLARFVGASHPLHNDTTMSTDCRKRRDDARARTCMRVAQKVHTQKTHSHTSSAAFASIGCTVRSAPIPRGPVRPSTQSERRAIGPWGS